MNLFQRLFNSEITRQVRAALAVHETDATFVQGSRSFQQGDRDRYDYDRQEVMEQALEAWRVNPLARRIVELTSQYVVGGGLSFECKNEVAHKFINKFWEHRLNRMSIRCTEWCDELSRTGNLFIVLTTDAAGMSYVRAIPATQVKEIKSAENDIEQPLSFTFYVQNTEHLVPSEITYTAYSQQADSQGEDGSFPVVMLHYAINRPVGAQWGESDLAPILRWLSRYANWLEDRARLNRYRTAFLYTVQSKFASEAERLARQQQLNATPPSPGSILVIDENEIWSVIEPKLAAGEANEDGLALKKMIAAGTGLPLHFLAEPESATRTTAEAAGGPTFRRFEQRQNYFMWLVNDILSIVVRRRAMVDRHLPAAPDFEVTGADISARDNVSLGMAVSNIVNSLAVLRDRQMIDDSEFLRLAYRFAGETVEVDELLAAGRKAGPPLGVKPDQPNVDQATPGKSQPIIRVKNPKLIDPATGDEIIPKEQQ
jgi:hypothetical protein